MVHLYCKLIGKNWDESSRDFVYYCGWFHAPLHFKLKRKKEKVANAKILKKELHPNIHESTEYTILKSIEI